MPERAPCLTRIVLGSGWNNTPKSFSFQAWCKGPWPSKSADWLNWLHPNVCGFSPVFLSNFSASNGPGKPRKHAPPKLHYVTISVQDFHPYIFCVWLFLSRNFSFLWPPNAKQVAMAQLALRSVATGHTCHKHKYQVNDSSQHCGYQSVLLMDDILQFFLVGFVDIVHIITYLKKYFIYIHFAVLYLFQLFCGDFLLQNHGRRNPATRERWTCKAKARAFASSPMGPNDRGSLSVVYPNYLTFCSRYSKQTHLGIKVVSTNYLCMKIWHQSKLEIHIFGFMICFSYVQPSVQHSFRPRALQQQTQDPKFPIL